MMRRTLITGGLLLAAALTPAATASAQTLTSTPYGAVDFGDQVAYRVAGTDCEATRPQIVVTAAGSDITGPASLPHADGEGCAGTSTVPSWSDVRATGWRQGDPISIALKTGDESVPLRYFRIEADQGKVAAGAPVTGPAGDQDTGDRDKALTMSTGDAVNLGRVDLTGVEGMSLRLCVTAGADGPTNTVPVPVAPDLGGNERIEPPVYMSIRQGSPTGPALIGPIDVSSNPTNGTRLATEGFGGCYRLLHLQVTGTPIDNAPELFASVDAAPPGVLELNAIDMDGTGAKIVSPREADPAGMQTIFDGSSWDGWTQSGCALHSDGTVSNVRTGAETDVGDCTMSYGKQLQNVVYRFDVRRRSFLDNGGIMTGDGFPVQIQLRTNGEWGPGGYYHDYAARADKLNSWPDWSHVQVAQLGSRIIVTINGRTVTNAVRPEGPPAPWTFGLASEAEWSDPLTAPASYGATVPTVDRPKQWGDFWWRNIRVLRCAGPDDPQCVALADPNPGQAPRKP